MNNSLYASIGYWEPSLHILVRWTLTFMLMVGLAHAQESIPLNNALKTPEPTVQSESTHVTPTINPDKKPPQTPSHRKHRILVLGDSISAGYGIPREKGWVALLDQKLQQEPLCAQQACQVINASVSGNTSSDGLGRFKALLDAHHPTLVILELGGNDGLRGYSLKTLKQNLSALIQQSWKASAKVVLLGIEIPPNYGKRYTDRFRAAFQDVVNQYTDQGVLGWVPFFLETVATRKDMMQADGIHPTTKAQPEMLNSAWPEIERTLKTP